MSKAHIQDWSRRMEKQLNFRLRVILNDPRMFALYQRFGARIFHRSSVLHGLDQFLKDNKVSGKRCYEIGTWNGLTAAVLSQYFDEVVTVDIAHNPEKHDVLEFLGIKNVRCIDIKGNHQKSLQGIPIDCAYIDGNHSEDTESDFALVGGCGRVIFHEVWPWQSPVWDLVANLPENQVTRGGVCFALWQQKKDERT